MNRTKRLYFLFVFFLKISGPFPIAKAIQPGLVFSIIARGLAVNCAILWKNAITDNIAIGAILPQVHVSLFRLLDSLILV